MVSLVTAVLGTASESKDHMPLLRWILINALAGFAILVLWHFGLVQVMFETDRTHISNLILALLVLTVAHCFYQTLLVSKELVVARHVQEEIAGAGRGFQIVGDRVLTQDGRELEQGVITRHIANLVTKSRAAGGQKIDQTLLLRSLAEQLRAREKLGWFVAEALLRLALLGTAVGFILMLIPIAGLKSFDVETLRNALAGMSGGMAIALNVTVAGIASALLLKVEYYFLDESVSDLFHLITDVTEVHVVSALERGSEARV